MVSDKLESLFRPVIYRLRFLNELRAFGQKKSARFTRNFSLLVKQVSFAKATKVWI